MSDSQHKPCQQCGEPYRAWPKNRKYCSACQALRDMDYRPGMMRKCEWCETTFYPFRTNYTKCPDCSSWRPEREDQYPECKQCGKHKRTAPGLASTCIACVQKDREAQSVYHRTLSRIIRDRVINRTKEV